MDLRNISLAIVCLPCKFENGYFLPTTKSVLTDLAGIIYEHPLKGILDMISDKSISQIMMNDGINNVIVVFDDLAAKRSWILPPGYNLIDSILEEFIQLQNDVIIKDNIESGIRIELMALSEFLTKIEKGVEFNKLVDTYIERFINSIKTKSNKLDFSLMSAEIVRRKRFYKEYYGWSKKDLVRQGLESDIVTKAAQQLANYVAEGVFVEDLDIHSYLTLKDVEAGLMSYDSPRFEKKVYSIDYELKVCDKPNYV